jgi:2-polyprenyl-6-methoxyphenol hydroxylase-like FAD-dependent oxidoreductase
VLIGADGLHSRVRAGLFGDTPPTYSGYTCWRAVVRFDHTLLWPGESWGRGARFGQVGMSGGQVYWFATKDAPAGGRGAAGEKAELQRVFRGWHEPVEQLIAATDESVILRHDIYDRPVLGRWGNGRVTLLGDAAHAMTPNLGQGACQAIEDAVVLARELAARRDLPGALRSYETRRIGRANSIVTASRRLGAIGQWSHPLAVPVRNWLMAHVASRLQARQIEQVVGYRV